MLFFNMNPSFLPSFLSSNSLLPPISFKVILEEPKIKQTIKYFIKLDSTNETLKDHNCQEVRWRSYIWYNHCTGSLGLFKNHVIRDFQKASMIGANINLGLVNASLEEWLLPPPTLKEAAVHPFLKRLYMDPTMIDNYIILSHILKAWVFLRI